MHSATTRGSHLQPSVDPNEWAQRMQLAKQRAAELRERRLAGGVDSTASSSVRSVPAPVPQQSAPPVAREPDNYSYNGQQQSFQSQPSFRGKISFDQPTVSQQPPPNNYSSQSYDRQSFNDRGYNTHQSQQPPSAPFSNPSVAERSREVEDNFQNFLRSDEPSGSRNRGGNRRPAWNSDLGSTDYNSTEQAPINEAPVMPSGPMSTRQRLAMMRSELGGADNSSQVTKEYSGIVNKRPGPSATSGRSARPEWNSGLDDIPVGGGMPSRPTEPQDTAPVVAESNSFGGPPKQVLSRSGLKPAVRKPVNPASSTPFSAAPSSYGNDDIPVGRSLNGGPNTLDEDGSNTQKGRFSSYGNDDEPVGRSAAAAPARNNDRIQASGNYRLPSEDDAWAYSGSGPQRSGFDDGEVEEFRAEPSTAAARRPRVSSAAAVRSNGAPSSQSRLSMNNISNNNNIQSSYSSNNNNNNFGSDASNYSSSGLRALGASSNSGNPSPNKLQLLKSKITNRATSANSVRGGVGLTRAASAGMVHAAQSQSVYRSYEQPGAAARAAGNAGHDDQVVGTSWSSFNSNNGGSGLSRRAFSSNHLGARASFEDEEEEEPYDVDQHYHSQQNRGLQSNYKQMNTDYNSGGFANNSEKASNPPPFKQNHFASPPEQFGKQQNQFAGGNDHSDNNQELEEYGTVELFPCSQCGRKFSEESLAVHERVCAKLQQKRKTFKVAVVDDEAKKLASSGSTKAQTMSKTRRPHSDTPVGPTGGAGAGAGGVANKTKWNEKSNQLREAMRAARQYKEAVAAGINPASLAPPVASAPDPSLVPCPHCGRRFNETAAERHIPKCKDIKAKPTMLKRGSGVTISSANSNSVSNSSSSQGAGSYNYGQGRDIPQMPSLPRQSSASNFGSTQGGGLLSARSAAGNARQSLSGQRIAPGGSSGYGSGRW